jgi:ATP-binding cassette subfamily C protein LapB
LDGADISQFSRSELATWIGYVPQENVLFAGTVRGNIAHRIPDASDEEIIRAAKAAGIHQFIIDQPDGYATEIGEAGQRLSGGQRQRISIARALVGQPPVLLLDEPSSSLDRQAEHDLRKTLEEIGRACTVVIVTHSPILLSACRDLFALDRGRLALAGPAQEILPRLFGAGARAAATPPATGGQRMAGKAAVPAGGQTVSPGDLMAAQAARPPRLAPNAMEEIVPLPGTTSGTKPLLRVAPAGRPRLTVTEGGRKATGTNGMAPAPEADDIGEA